MYKIKSFLWVVGFMLFSLFLVACGSSATSETSKTAESTAVSIADDNDANQVKVVLALDEGEETAVSPAVAETEAEVARPEGWSDETHSKSADPNYEVVFPDDQVNSMTIAIAPEDWQAMLDDMTETYGELGSNSRAAGQGGFGEGRPAPPVQGEPGDAPPAAFAPGGGDSPGGGAVIGDFTAENPIWVPSTIEFEGDVWTDVGVRFKGNSSLTNAWSSGSLELPFKLDFDEYEDENPAIDNQRFYGFKQLSLSNNTNDNTFMRDAVVSDIMEEAGLASAETAFYELFVDYGEGPVSFGLYTMIEVIDDTVIDRVFGDDDGNIYEADGTAVSLAAGTVEGISESFQKENNKDEADWSDIEALYTALHADTRHTDPETWKAELEAIFDVDTFLHWLAINTVIENWDTYGAAAHNFYLYNNPETGLLTWIPWDHNEALNEGRRSNMTLSMEAIGDEWPLISYLLADDEYYAAYVNYVDETVNTNFVADEMTAKYETIASLIEPYAAEKVGAEAFAQAVQALIDHTYGQISEAQTFVAQEMK